MQVIRVIDGDSIRVKNRHEKSLEIRLFGIDAPEHNQPFAQQAKRQTQRLLKNRSVTVIGHQRDRYQRLVATVFIDGQSVSLNEQLIEQGAAWVYRQYSQDPAWIALEESALLKQRGLWALPADQRIPPWEWRKTHPR